NIVVEDKGIYKTPAIPLLKGTQRAALIEDGLIQESVIRLEDLFRPCTIHLINALMPLGTLSMPGTSITIKERL
ncbi:MAG: 4-amino-4-deoxychorismate lyase, partial [Porphyromonas sp.]|nr:4-amino-4-deoxychorismate lyase [Porphyromonas sp.]